MKPLCPRLPAAVPPPLRLQHDLVTFLENGAAVPRAEGCPAGRGGEPEPSSTKLAPTVNRWPRWGQAGGRRQGEQQKVVLRGPGGHPSADRPQGSCGHLFCDLHFPIVVLWKIWRDPSRGGGQEFISSSLGNVGPTLPLLGPPPPF